MKKKKIKLEKDEIVIIIVGLILLGYILFNVFIVNK